jgi:hypothetical protein
MKNSPKQPPPAGELPLATAAAALLFSVDGKPTVRAEVIEQLTGLNDQALRRMAARGVFPAPVKARYALDATLAGIYRELSARAGGDRANLDKISFPSMEACEATTGITKSLQQLAKTSGCPGFRDTRVYLLDLVKWIFKEAAAGHVADWGKMNVELDAKLKQVKLDTELRELIRLDESADCLQRLAEIFWGGLRRMEMENPRDFEMRPRDYIKKHTREKTTTIRTQIENELKKLKLETETTAPVNTEK